MLWLRHRPLKQLTSTKSGPFLKFVDHLANAAGGAEPLSGLVDVAKEVLRKVREVIAAEVTFVKVRNGEGEAAAKPGPARFASACVVDLWRL